MALEAEQETAMTAALYAALGQTVTYTGQAEESASIKIILSDGSESFAGGFENQTADRNASARIKISDVAAVRRGDTITTASGFDWYVDTYERLNACEWDVQLRPCDV